MAKSSEERSLSALKHDYIELLNTVEPRFVTVERIAPKPGMMCRLRVTVKAPTAYIQGGNDSEPVETDRMSFYVNVKKGYPEIRPEITYDSDRRLASVHVYSWGAQCLGWARNSSLAGIVSRTIREIIYDPALCDPDRLVEGRLPNRSLADWQRRMIETGACPTIEPGRLFRVRDEL